MQWYRPRASKQEGRKRSRRDGSCAGFPRSLGVGEPIALCLTLPSCAVAAERRYPTRHGGPVWKAFERNVSAFGTLDFLTVPTINFRVRFVLLICDMS